MEFETKAGDLRAALSVCARVVQPRIVIPIMANVLLDASAGSVRLTCSNLDQVAQAKCAADMRSAGKITVSATGLLAVLSNIDGEAACSMSVSDKRDLIFKSGRARVTLRAITADDFPQIEDVAFDATATFAPAEITAALSVSYAASTATDRAYLNGVSVSSYKGGIDFAASDGNRLALYHLPSEGYSAPSVIIPAVAVKQFMAAISASKESESVSLSVSAIFARISFASGMSLTTKLVDGNFPEARRFTDNVPSHSAIVDREEILRALGLVASVCDDRATIAVEFSDGRIGLSAQSPDAGESGVDMEAEVDGPNSALSVALSHRYMSAAIGSFDTTKLRIAFGGPGDAVHFFGVGSDSGHAIVMPRRF